MTNNDDQESDLPTSIIAARAEADAAKRIFDTLTEKMKASPHLLVVSWLDGDRFKVAVDTRGGRLTFSGQTVQDAFAQLAQTLALSEDKEF